MKAAGILKISTSDIASSRFAPHGLVEICFQGDILVYECFGPFNKELVDAMAIAQMKFLTAVERDDSPWASICLMRGSSVASPEAMARYAEMMQSPKPDKLTPVATAFSIAPEVEGGRFMLPLFAAIYAGIKRPFEGFEQLDDAKVWAQSMIDAEKKRRGSA